MLASWAALEGSTLKIMSPRKESRFLRPTHDNVGSTQRLKMQQHKEIEELHEIPCFTSDYRIYFLLLGGLLTV